ncbi:MAG: hypothetical protein JWM27_4760 [Gemmatimonadetes bacterium]|nr:hypothetical protein [Gemmatimonadota bacterium]
MVPNVVIGQATRLPIQHVVVIYARGDSPVGLTPEAKPRGDLPDTFASLHHPVGDDAGTVHLGPGRAVTLDFVRTLERSLGRSLQPEFLPEYVLARTPDVTVWWSPARLRTLFWREGSSLAAMDGQDVPVPALLWRLTTDGGLAVRALATSSRPEVATPCYVAPLWNVNDAGIVCQGSMKTPRSRGVGSLRAWEDAVFGAQFTHAQAQNATRMKGGLTALWKSLKGKKRFPAAELLDAGTALSFIRGVW